jgi:hypothetical protein
VEVESRKGELNCFDLIGPKSQALLYAVLQLADLSSPRHQLWDKLKEAGVTNAAALPADCVLALKGNTASPSLRLSLSLPVSLSFVLSSLFLSLSMTPFSLSLSVFFLCLFFPSLFLSFFDFTHPSSFSSVLDPRGSWPPRKYFKESVHDIIASETSKNFRPPDVWSAQYARSAIWEAENRTGKIEPQTSVDQKRSQGDDAMVTSSSAPIFSVVEVIYPRNVFP